MVEEWKPVVGWEGLYEVSNLGQVKRVGKEQGTKCKVLRQVLRKDGRYSVSLSRKSKSGHLLVHALVAAAFIGPKPIGKDVNHIDGNKQNNASSNLEYITRSENIKHSYRLGIHPRMQGELCGQSKLSSFQVAEIKRLRKSGMRYDHISPYFDVSPQHISRICRGIDWKHTLKGNA